MTYLNAKKHIAALPEALSEEKPGARLAKALARLGNPQKNLKHLRLTGSNGKSVTAGLLLSIASHSPYRVGYLSHHSESEPRQAIRIGEEAITMEQMATLTDSLRKLLAEGEEPLALSQSEFMLCLGLMAFREAKTDFSIIEEDPQAPGAARHLPVPFGAVICGTIPHSDPDEIQGIRSGIRHGIREIVSAPQDKDAYSVIFDTSSSVGCRLTVPPRAMIEALRLSLRSTEFAYNGKAYTVGVCGRFQIANAALVLETVEMLGRNGFAFSEEAVRQGLAEVKLPCKFEILSVTPTVIADSTHSPVAIETVCRSMADFRDTIGSRVILCLPDGPLAEQYTKILSEMDYSIPMTLLLSDRSEVIDSTYRFHRKKELVKTALKSLTPDTILLISGPHAFTENLRYTLLQEM